VSPVVIHSRPAKETDRIDEIVGFWCHENPALDVTLKCLTMRLRSASRLVDRALRQELASLDVEMWEPEMLLSLRQAPGMQSSAGALLRASGVTSGAITNRLSRLEGSGWIRRQVDPSDRRQVLVTLTDAGRSRADQLIAAKNLSEQRFYADVPRETLERLERDLRTLLTAVEPDSPTPLAGGEPDGPAHR
jgi:DNA-binding MarR family transcriptional regulator